MSSSLTTSDCQSPVQGSSYSADRYSFSGTAGQQLTILLTSSAFDTYLYLIGPSGSVIANDDDGGGGSDSRIPAGSGGFSLPSSGTYIIEVTSYYPGGVGSYTLSLSTFISCSVTSISIGQTASGSLSASDCRSPVRGSGYYADRYSFGGSSGQQVAILLTSSAFDTYVYLIGPSGSVIYQNDDGGGGTNSRIPAGSGFFTLPSSGTYVIEVTSFFAGTLGSYTLRLATPCTPSAVPIGVGQTMSSSLTTSDCQSPVQGSSYSADRYSFSGTAGQQVTILLTSSAFDTYLYLIGPSGSVIANDDDGGGGSDSRIPAGSGGFSLPSSGTYIIEVTSYYAGGAGSYALSLSTFIPCLATSISIGQTPSGSLSTGDCRSPIRGSGYYADRYSFSGSAGQQVAILLASSVFDTYVYLIGPSGSLIYQDDDGGGGTNSRIPAGGGFFVLPSSGTYIIEVTSFSNNRTGSYSLSLTR
jgi:hypothetical protein